MLRSLNDRVKGYIPGADTLRNWVDREVAESFYQVVDLLQDAKSRIHISFDLWSSPNGYAICGVVAHFVDKAWVNRQVLIALKKMTARHTGEEIAAVMVPVLREYGIANKIGVFVCDNVDLNDRAIHCILDDLGIDDYVENRRSRCLGHIINLVAKAFIFGRNTEAFEASANAVTESTPYDSEVMRQSQAAWRAKGPVGKLHNIVVFIRSSPQRREAFGRLLVGDDEVDDLMVILDNNTRWNSTFLSIQRALRLKVRIRGFCLEDIYEKELVKDLLSEEDWSQLADIAEGLEPFWQATKRVEGNARFGSHGCIWEALPIIEALQGVLEEGLRCYNPEKLEELLESNGPATRRSRSKKTAKSADESVTVHPLAIAYQNAWEKLRKYYNLTDNAHEIYAAAVLFHPSLRKQYFDDHWATETLTEWRGVMIDNVKKHFQQEYPAEEQQNLEERPKKKQREPDFLDLYLRKATTMSSPVSAKDAFDSYITGQPVEFDEDDKDAVFPWWRTFGPVSLRRRALDLLSIPAMSAEIERVFSSTKRLISTDRSRMNHESIEQLQLLKYWYSHGIVKERSVELEAVKRKIFGTGEGGDSEL